MIGGMGHGYFDPWAGPRRPCWHCARFEALICAASAALCTLRNGPRLRSMPRDGCGMFEREPGADDEPQVVPEAVSQPTPFG